MPSQRIVASDDNAGMVRIIFSLGSGPELRQVRLELPLPKRGDFKPSTTSTGKARPHTRSADQRWEQACRARWRVLVLLVRAKLEALGDEKGNPIGTKAHKPEDLYKTVNNVAPDLIVYFGDLAWRSAGSVGMEALHVFENDTGPDDANHAQNGMFILNGPGVRPGNRRGISLYDVAPTVLTTLGIPVPEEM